MARRSSRAKMLVFVVLALVAGASLTWMIAWGCALWAPAPTLAAGPGLRVRIGATTSAEEVWPAGWPAMPSGSYLDNEWRWEAEYAAFQWQGPGYAATRTCTLEVELYGWPLRTMRRAVAADTGWVPTAPPPPPPNLPPLLPSPPQPPPPPAPVPSTPVMRSLAAPAWLRPSPACTGLPTDVLWGPFITSSVAIGAVVLMLGAVALAGARRALRHMQRCPGCGYDRAGLGAGPACPGCGRAA
ncbi:MAG TPA: hypothetical protein VD997_12625 [Phycisphaerales bacterium]|nr:hypothetical protein [Phycisphaerales bacterium]